MLAFSIAGFVSLYLMQRLQAVLPFNPQGMAAVTPDLSFNTSVSFITNTNWQSYCRRNHHELSGADAGPDGAQFPVARPPASRWRIALIRGFARRSAKTLGNFWVDLTRCTLYVLLPLSF